MWGFRHQGSHLWILFLCSHTCLFSPVFIPSFSSTLGFYSLPDLQSEFVCHLLVPGEARGDLDFWIQICPLPIPNP